MYDIVILYNIININAGLYNESLFIKGGGGGLLKNPWCNSLQERVPRYNESHMWYD